MRAPALALSAGSAAAADPLADARDIARWLTSSGRDVPDGRIWPVDPEKPEEVTAHLYSGTSRLFYRLHEITDDAEWMRWVRMAAQGVLESGIPEKRTPGFWNNVSQCCGSAGVAEFFLSLHQITKEREYLDFARRLTDDDLARSTREERGLRFVQAENRTQPERLQAQTGYMQGAAGIGLWLLRLHAFEKGERPGVILPDSPFPP